MTIASGLSEVLVRNHKRNRRTQSAAEQAMKDSRSEEALHEAVLEPELRAKGQDHGDEEEEDEIETAWDVAHGPDTQARVADQHREGDTQLSSPSQPGAAVVTGSGFSHENETRARSLA